MPRYDAKEAEVLVFTFKEGVLSAVAHDLKIRVEDFSIDVEDESAIRARFDPSSLRVVTPMKDGREHSGLREKDRREIEGNIRKDVLHVKRHGEITFESSSVDKAGDGYRIEGELTLHGTSRTVRTEAKREGGRWVAEVTLHQPDFGIKPYRAAMGTLRVKADVTVRVSVPAKEAG